MEYLGNSTFFHWNTDLLLGVGKKSVLARYFFFLEGWCEKPLGVDSDWWKEIHPALKESRIIQIPTHVIEEMLYLSFGKFVKETYHNFFGTGDRNDGLLTDDMISSLSVVGLDGSREDIEKHRLASIEASVYFFKLDKPRELPFDLVYYGFEEPIEMKGLSPFSYFRDEDPDSFDNSVMFCRHLLGGGTDAYDFVKSSFVSLLVSKDVCCAFFLLDGGQGGQSMGTPLYLRNYPFNLRKYPNIKQVESRWQRAAAVNMAVQLFIDWTNDHKMIIEQPSIAGKMLAKKTSKAIRGRVIPPPYYTVIMHDGYVDKSEDRQEHKAAIRSPYSHRFDVRAHDAIRIRRGKLPLDDEDRAKLLAARGSGRRYQVFERSSPSGDLALELRKRNVPPKAQDEWLAVLRYPVRASIKPSREDLPYVPSIRKSQKEKGRG